MNNLPCKHKLYIPFMLIGIALLAILPTSCTCNCSPDDGVGGGWRPDRLGLKPTKIAFVSDRDDIHDIYVMNEDGSGAARLTENNLDDSVYYLSWSPDGNKISFAMGSDWIIGDSENWDEIIRYRKSTSNQPLSWSPDSNKVAYKSVQENIEIRNPDGTLFSTISIEAIDGNRYVSEASLFLSWSPDGGKIAFTWETGGYKEIHVIDIDGLNEVNLTGLTWGNDYPAWSPSGSQIAFESSGDLMVMDTDGSNQIKLTVDFEYWVDGAFMSWSPDGSKLVFSILNEPEDIYVINSDGSNLITLTNSPNSDSHPTWSPTSTQIAFSSNMDGDWDIYIINVDGSGLTNLTNTSWNEQYPAWRP